MRIAILGMGGVGATVAAALQKVEKDLVFIARGETKKAIEKNGLVFDSEKLGKRIIHPALVSDRASEIGKVDVLFLCCKSYGLKEACERYRGVVSEDTLVIPLQNGVTAQKEATEYLQGMGKIAYGYIYCLSNIQAVGYVGNIGNLLRIGFGFPDGRKNEKAEALAKLLEEGGLPTFYGSTILKAVWEKYAMMCGNSCAFLYFNCEAGGIQQDQEKLAFLKGVYEDIKRLAIAAGGQVSEDMPEKYLAEFLTVPPQTTSSLYRDIRDGKENTELEALIGNGCRLAKEGNVSIPFMEMVYESRK